MEELPEELLGERVPPPPSAPPASPPPPLLVKLNTNISVLLFLFGFFASDAAAGVSGAATLFDTELELEELLEERLSSSPPLTP